MKNYFFIVLVFVLYVQYSNAQSPIRFVDTTNRWKAFWHPNAIPFDEVRTFFFTTDSVQIEGDYFYPLSYTTAGISSTDIKKSGLYFRQAGSKVYKAYSIDSKPFLLYDFGLHLEEGLYPQGIPISFYQKINATDSIVLDNNQKVKRMNVVCNTTDNPNPATWIEGIGDTENPFTPEPQCSLFDPIEYETLMCFSAHGEVVYKNERFQDCSIEGQFQHFKFTDSLNKWLIVYYSTPFYEKRVYFLKESLFQGYKEFCYYKVDNKKEIFTTALFVRQEGEKVFIFDVEDQVEKILVDFSLKVNDILEDPTHSVSQIIKNVTIDTLLDGSLIKSLDASCFDSGHEYNLFTWFEGIGNNRLPIHGRRSCISDASGEDEYFVCFMRNDKVLYEHPKYLNCKFFRDAKYVDKDNEWIYYTYDGPNIFSTKQKFDLSDSLRSNGKSYFALKSSNTQLGTDFNEVVGYFREEDNKVFQLKDDGELLKYDFNHVVGDTIEYVFEGNMKTKYIIKDVDYRLFYSTEAFSSKILTLECIDSHYQFKWMQGIGEEEVGIQCYFDGINTYLSCYLHNNQPVYKRDPLGNCWRVSTEEAILNNWQISQNPVYNNLEIYSSDMSLVHADIFSIDGKHWAKTENSFFEDLSFLPSGIYLIKVLFNNGTTGIKKFSKI